MKRLLSAPAFVYNCEYFELAEMLEGVGFSAVTAGKVIKLRFADLAGYRVATRVLSEKGVEFHSFLMKDEIDAKYVVRGLPLKTSVEKFTEKIALEGFKPGQVTQLKVRGRPAPLFLVYFSAS